MPCANYKTIFNFQMYKEQRPYTFEKANDMNEILLPIEKKNLD